ncbi:MAG: hypothetical protein FIA98_14570, partial [Anaerolineae bacterium]|nr:hypothetical protein [Anaerolineae bacterium]
MRLRGRQPGPRRGGHSRCRVRHDHPFDECSGPCQGSTKGRNDARPDHPWVQRIAGCVSGQVAVCDKEMSMCVDHPPFGGAALAEALAELYALGQTDYSFEPVILADALDRPLGRIQDGDAVIFCLRRGEREIQLTEAFVEPETGGFPRCKFENQPFVILTLYHEKFKDLPVAFAPTQIKHTLAETISRAGLRQLHISESEKFAHVTFFFNGGTNQPFAGETDVHVPSLRD